MPKKRMTANQVVVGAVAMVALASVIITTGVIFEAVNWGASDQALRDMLPAPQGETRTQ